MWKRANKFTSIFAVRLLTMAACFSPSLGCTASGQAFQADLVSTSLPLGNNIFNLGMRVLLRDATTGLYFREPENWTAETNSAQAFRHSAEAMNIAREHRVEHAEVVLAFEEPDYTVALPLP